ncbi:hypothetical protein A8L34_24725 [Bacillus sp. FJAT-27264]|uniref:hypothetical protein n=1 Tax=Paenibacillus sp. (strain DSM 101736 / FJAT-27264) TaxID=1850362 RepID=UPI000807E426|nr:hypothetical protein [Bacillus sp. FJAT-27264]OBZ07840.1 hypothetical protein A8L34_24725 [Bacillus sp. FJAT-27264]
MMRAKNLNVLSLLLALLFSYSYSEVFIPLHNKGMGYRIFIYVYLLVFVYFVIRFLLKRASLIISNGALSRKIAKAGLLALISVLFVLFIPKEYITPINYTNVTLTPEIAVNSTTTTSEVWLTGIKNGDNLVGLTEIELPKGWILKEGAIVFSGSEITPLNLKFASKERSKLIFGKHAWSGKVKVYDGQKTNVIDLYSKAQDSTEILVNQSIGSDVILTKVLAAITFAFTFSVFFLTLLFTLKKMLMRKRLK